jgi:hypothetical protein
MTSTLPNRGQLTAIATLRCQQASNRWDQIWQQPTNQTATATPGIASGTTLRQPQADPTCLQICRVPRAQ